MDRHENEVLVVRGRESRIRAVRKIIHMYALIESSEKYTGAMASNTVVVS